MLFEIKNKVANKYLDEECKKDKHAKRSLKKCQLFSNDDARIITSGKVYRQLFESEVQLINALQKVKFTVNTKVDKIKITDSPTISKKNYLPSIFRHQEDNCDTAVNKEVSTLPENLLPTKTQSELIVKIVESRKLKFNKQFEELQQSIGIINKDVHAIISDICEEYNNYISLNKSDVESNFTIFNVHSQMELCWEQFTTIELRIEENIVQQSSLIDVLYDKLVCLETNRVGMVLQEISNSSTKLERIGHLAPSEVHRMINNILIDTNDSILRNKEIYSDLRTKLLLSTYEENRKRQIFLKNQIISWSEEISNAHLDNFKTKIQHEESSSVSTIKELLINLDGIICRLSLDLNDTLEDMVANFDPERYDSKFLSGINNRILLVMTEFDKDSDKFMKFGYKKIEEINHKYLTEMNDIKTLLVRLHVFEKEEDCSKAVEGFCWPYLGCLQKTFEEKLDTVEAIIEETRKKLECQSKKVHNYLLTLLNLWNEHKVSLNKAEEVVQQKLNSNRDAHQQQNLIAENSLNLIIDKMRQDSNEVGLKDNLPKCMNQLDKIKASYLHFYDLQNQIVKRYPALAEAEVKIFEEVLTNFFAADQEEWANEGKYEEDQDTKKKQDKRDGTFMTHFISLQISNETLVELKKKIMDGYREFIEQWFKKVATNTSKIVSTKVEELESELKLRYHLHEPRYQRIEYDIHNVRATELVIHAERVFRQCKTIENSLENVKQEYLKLDEEQRVKQDTFKEKLAADEVSYMTVTNHSKLMNIKTVLEERNNKYMQNLRTSLRTFRQHIETSLQNLRQSNSEFVRSFKLFSVGGNFCPGEIDDFTRKIEKTNVKIEETESEIMSNLEMVEKIHQDNLTLLKTAFEEKFKYHIVDINFMETLNRAMSNIQCKIKTEFSNSNSQSQLICEKIQLLDSTLREIYKNGKCQVDFLDPRIVKSILDIFGCINDRSIYLDCIKTQGCPKDQLTLADNKDGNNYNVKIQFANLTVISKGGRQPNEDAGIKSVKNLLKTQKNYLNEQNTESPNDTNSVVIPKNDFDADNSNKNTQTRSPSINSELTTNRKGVSEKSKLVNKNQRLDKKYQVFGEEDSEEGFTFMKKINFYCRDILNGILYQAELYYINKGVRKVTQPTLQDNFDQAAKDIITRLKYYFKQTSDYHDDCLQEFNKQLLTLEDALCTFPAIVYRNILEKMISECNHEIRLVNEAHSKEFHDISTKKKCNYNDLRPELSQTSKEIELKRILALEESVFGEEMNLIDKQFQLNKMIALSSGKVFAKVVKNVTEQLLLLMDNLLTTTDVYNSEPKPRFVDTKELLRKQVMTSVEEVGKSRADIITTKNTWVFNDLNDILEADSSYKVERDESSCRCLITAKNTACHTQSIKEREISVKKYKGFYFELLSKIEETHVRKLEEANNYKSFWDESVKKLREMNDDI